MDAHIMEKMAILVNENDPAYVNQLCENLNADLLEYCHRHGIRDMKLDNIPKLHSALNIRDTVFQVESFSHVNDRVIQVSEFHTTDNDKVLFSKCFTSDENMKLVREEIIRVCERDFTGETIYVYPPLFITSSRCDVIKFKRTPDTKVTVMLLFLEIGPVIPLVFDLQHFRHIISKYRLYSLQNMDSNAVRGYLEQHASV